MNEPRDRLAADLHAPCVEYYRWRATNDPNSLITQHDADAHRENADRLIALGWTRREPSVREDAAKHGIRVTDHGLPPEVVRPPAFADDYAATDIAKEYREDTDAR